MWASEASKAEAEATAARWREDGYECEVVAMVDQSAIAAAEATERERCAKLQQAWEDTRTQRDELLAHIAGRGPLPQWAADWLRA